MERCQSSCPNAGQHHGTTWASYVAQASGTAQVNQPGKCHRRRSHAKLVATISAVRPPRSHVRGGPAHVMAPPCRGSFLKRQSRNCTRQLLYAIVCGDVAEIERTLRERPEAAERKALETATIALESVGSRTSQRRRTYTVGAAALPVLHATLVPPATTRDRDRDAAAGLMARIRTPTSRPATAPTHRWSERSERAKNSASASTARSLVRLLLKGAPIRTTSGHLYTHFNGDVEWYLQSPMPAL